MAPLMPDGGSLVTLDFDNRVAWPVYDWMGVAKSALESVVPTWPATSARDGSAFNAVAAGPLATLAARHPRLRAGRSGMEEARSAGMGRPRRRRRRPHGHRAAQRLGAATTGELIHVDGGYHAMGADLPEAEG